MEILEQLPGLALFYAWRVVGAILIVLIGRWLAGALANTSEKAARRSQSSEALVRFGRNIVYWGILALAVISALGVLGIETATFAALIAAAGLAIGLALEGALGNFASGVLILMFRPFEIGHMVELDGRVGVVEDIQVFSTVMRTPENKTVIIPNGQITSNSIVNYTRKGTLRVDMVFGIGYDDDLLRAKQILQELVDRDERVLREPAPVVSVLELGDSSVNFAVRPFVPVAHYWDVYFDMQEQVKLRFDQESISIPFPQQDVHLFPAGSN